MRGESVAACRKRSPARSATYLIYREGGRNVWGRGVFKHRLKNDATLNENCETKCNKGGGGDAVRALHNQPATSIHEKPYSSD